MKIKKLFRFPYNITIPMALTGTILFFAPLPEKFALTTTLVPGVCIGTSFGISLMYLYCNDKKGGVKDNPPVTPEKQENEKS